MENPSNTGHNNNAHFAEYMDVIVNSTAIGLWDWNLVTGEVIYSSQWEKIAGYEPGELPQDVTSWSNALLPEDLAATEAIIDRYLAGEGDYYEAEFRMVRKDGSIIWAQDKGTVTEWDENGTPIRLVGVLQDVTRIKTVEHDLQKALRENEKYNERLQAEIQNVLKNLEESRKSNQMMFEANPYVNLIFDHNFKVVDCNPSAVRYLGYSSREDLLENVMTMIENSIPEHQPDGRRSRPLVSVLESAARNGSMDFETQLMLNGRETPMSIVLKRIDYGDTFSIALYQVDLTSVKAAQDELLNQDMLLTSVNFIASLLISGGAGDFDWVMHQALETLGTSVSSDRVFVWQTVSRDGEECMRQVYLWADRKYEAAWMPATPCRIFMPNWYGMLASGTIVNSSLELSPMPERNTMETRGTRSILLIPISLSGKFWGALGFDYCSDDKLFSESEQGILHSAGFLIAAAMLRNEMMENLIHARNAALQSAEAKSNFLANMSHEIRTPMNAIMGMTTIAKGARDDAARVRDCLDKIAAASQHLLGLINDVLDMSKIDANKFVLSEKKFSFRRMLQNVYDINLVAARENSQTLDMKIDDAITDAVIGDELRASQVVSNLLSNAVKFSPEGGRIVLTASEAENMGDSSRISISIEDNGIGIPADKIGKLFKVFEQVDATRSRKFEGTGLGLAISRGIVEMMGGHMEVESEHGVGSRFTFDIVLKHQRLDMPEARAVGAKADDGASSDFSGRRILLAEDIEINREIIEMFFDGTGLELDYAENGQEAYDKFISAPDAYDLIFMDVHMPVMDGFEATEMIRSAQTERALTIPIVAMTANAFSEDIERCKSVGMDDHIAKPVDIDVLMEKTRRYMTSGRE